MSRVLFVLFLLLGFVWQLCPAACAFEEAYMPFSKNILSRRFLQKPVQEFLRVGQTRRLGCTEISLRQGDLLDLHGCSELGNSWSLRADTSGCLVSVWIADLDSNGKEDLIFFLRKTECSEWCPSSRLLLLMFDRDSLPSSRLIEGFFNQDSYGVMDLLDTDRDGRAELLVQSIDHGYWVSSIYEAVSSSWRRCDSLEGIQLPLFTRFSFLPNRTAVCPPAGRYPQVSDFSKQSLFGPAHVERLPSRNGDLLLASSRGRTQCFQLSPSLICVLDKPHERLIAVGDSPSAMLLAEITSRGISARLATACIKGKKLVEFVSASSAGTLPEAPCRQNLDLALRMNLEIP